MSVFEKLMDGLSDDERKRFLNFFDDARKNPGILTELSDAEYDYERPDYDEMAKPAGETFGYFEEVFTLFGLPIDIYSDVYSLDQFLDDCSKLSKEALESEMSSAIYRLLAAYHRKESPSTFPLKLAYILAAIERFSLDGCVPAVLELARQEAAFLDEFIGLLITPLPALLAHLNPKSLVPLLDVVSDDRLVKTSRQQIALAVGYIGIEHPERRLEVDTWLTQLFERIHERGEQTKLADDTMIDAACQVMAMLHATELLPKLEAIFDACLFFSAVLGSTRDIINFIKNKSLTLEDMLLEPDYDNMKEFVEARLERSTVVHDDDDFEVLDELLPNSEMEYDNKIAPVELTLNIKLQGIDPPIWRRIAVPSNITLNSLAHLVLIAMGWDGGHLYGFTKNGLDYTFPWREEDEEEDFFSRYLNPQEDIREHCAGELLPRRRSWVTFEYGICDSWEHRITVVDTRHYAKGERPEVRLIDGARACPPEDVGGAWEYKEMCEALKKPRSKKAREYHNRLGYRFDPEEFDLETAIEAIQWLN